ncbi:hypothetical protein K438DRAFT_2012195 [Mycena galopus ATCC 62051]|nr:hypothetical protein K438DRAFT_2012195 [Mycena galopus ATCC 62051]
MRPSRRHPWSRLLTPTTRYPLRTPNKRIRTRGAKMYIGSRHPPLHGPSNSTRNRHSTHSLRAEPYWAQRPRSTPALHSSLAHRLSDSSLGYTNRLKNTNAEPYSPQSQIANRPPSTYCAQLEARVSSFGFWHYSGWLTPSLTFPSFSSFVLPPNLSLDSPDSDLASDDLPARNSPRLHKRKRKRKRKRKIATREKTSRDSGVRSKPVDPPPAYPPTNDGD